LLTDRKNLKTKMLGSIKEILEKASRKKYAVGAFNVSSMESAQAVAMAAIEKKSPCIIQITEKSLKYAGEGEIVEIAKNAIKERSNSVPIGINLDHGKTFELVSRAIGLGFNGVMIDGSRLSFKENKVITKRVVNHAHKHNITVQGELGIVPYLGEIEESEVDWDKLMTDPQQAIEFVENTGVDSLAVAIGNAHGFFRETREPDWKRLTEIRKSVATPLVLHGASDWMKEKVEKANQCGISCYNVDTDIRLAFVSQLCKSTDEKCTTTDPRKIMDTVRESIKSKVMEKMDLFGSSFKA